MFFTNHRVQCFYVLFCALYVVLNFSTNPWIYNLSSVGGHVRSVQVRLMSGPFRSCRTQLRSVQCRWRQTWVRSVQIRSGKVSSDLVAPRQSQVSSDQVRSGWVRSGQIRSRSDQVRSCWSQSGQVRSGRIRPESGQVRPGWIRSGQAMTCPHEVSSSVVGHVRAVQVRSMSRSGRCQVKSDQVELRSGQFRAGCVKTESGQFRSDQIRLGQVRSGNFWSTSGLIMRWRSGQVSTGSSGQSQDRSCQAWSDQVRLYI